MDFSELTTSLFNNFLTIFEWTLKIFLCMKVEYSQLFEYFKTALHNFCPEKFKWVVCGRKIYSKHRKLKLFFFYLFFLLRNKKYKNFILLGYWFFHEINIDYWVLIQTYCFIWIVQKPYIHSIFLYNYSKSGNVFKSENLLFVKTQKVYLYVRILIQKVDFPISNTSQRFEMHIYRFFFIIIFKEMWLYFT